MRDEEATENIHAGKNEGTEAGEPRPPGIGLARRRLGDADGEKGTDHDDRGDRIRDRMSGVCSAGVTDQTTK
jgi:hypothetical protein